MLYIALFRGKMGIIGISVLARAQRHYIPGQIWHITHRCHKREFLLKFSKDRRRWVQWLYEAKKRYGLMILNYTVTSNHVHLLVVGDHKRETIPNSIKLIAGRTGQEFNQRKNRKGGRITSWKRKQHSWWYMDPKYCCREWEFHWENKIINGCYGNRPNKHGSWRFLPTQRTTCNLYRPFWGQKERYWAWKQLFLEWLNIDINRLTWSDPGPSYVTFLLIMAVFNEFFMAVNRCQRLWIFAKTVSDPSTWSKSEKGLTKFE